MGLRCQGVVAEVLHTQGVIARVLETPGTMTEVIEMQGDTGEGQGDESVQQTHEARSGVVEIQENKAGEERFTGAMAGLF